MRVGFTNGCFDLLHEGHKHFLRECRKQCDQLWVGINSDSSVKALKGDSRPVWGQGAREYAVISMPEVTRAFIFSNESELESMIRTVKPDILFKGSDYEGKPITGADYVRSYGGKVVLIPLLDGHSTTKLIDAQA